MGSSIGFNIPDFSGTFSASGVQARFFAHTQKVRPRWGWCYGVDTARTLHANGVENVGVRHWPDGGVAEKLSADDWQRKYEGIWNAGDWAWACFTNEMGLQVENAVRICKPALREGARVTFPAISSGTPEPADWQAARPLFELLAEYPHTSRMEIHEYIPGIPGNVKAALWSMSMPFDDPDLRWYNGRYQRFAYPYLDQWGLPHPKYVISEFGVAAQNGMVNSINPSNGYPSFNGWYSGTGFYEHAYPGQSAAKTVAQFTTYLVEKCYAPDPAFEGLCFYTWGSDLGRPLGSSEDWSGFDGLRDPEPFYQEYERYAMSVSNPPPPVVTPPVITPQPAGEGVLSQLKTIPVRAGFVNIRSTPDASKDEYDIGDLYVDVQGLLWNEPAHAGWIYFRPLDGDTRVVWNADTTLRAGWVSLQSGNVVFDPVVIPPPVEPPPPPPPLPPPEALYSPWLTGTEVGQMAALYTQLVTNETTRITLDNERIDIIKAIGDIFQKAFERTQQPTV